MVTAWDNTNDFWYRLVEWWTHYKNKRQTWLFDAPYGRSDKVKEAISNSCSLLHRQHGRKSSNSSLGYPCMSCSSQRGPGHDQGTIQVEMGQQAQYRTGSARESHSVGVDHSGPAFLPALGLLIEGLLIELDSKSASLGSVWVELNNCGAEKGSSKIQWQFVLFESLGYRSQNSGSVIEKGNLLPGY